MNLNYSIYSFFHPIAQTNTTKFDLKENENYISKQQSTDEMDILLKYMST